MFKHCDLTPCSEALDSIQTHFEHVAGLHLTLGAGMPCLVLFNAVKLCTTVRSTPLAFNNVLCGFLHNML